MFIEISTPRQTSLRDMLRSYIHPETGNPQGCMALLNLYEILLSFMDRAIQIQKENPSKYPKDDDGVNATGQSTTIFPSDLAGASQPVINTFTIEHTFSNYYDGNFPINTGFDFLGGTYNGMERTPTTSGLRVVALWSGQIFLT